MHSRNEIKNYDIDQEGDCEKFDYELPSKVFIYLYRFIAQIGNKGKDVMVNNFEILVKCCEKPPEAPEDEYPQIAFTVGKINFYKTVSSSIKREIENNRIIKRREMLKRNFDKQDDWSNVKPHCHVLNEHEEGLMVLPEFKINHKHYSTHALFKDFEPIRRSEHFKIDNEGEIDKPCKTRKTYDYITKMIEDSKISGKVITQDDIFKIIKKMDPELYNNYLEGEVTPVFKIDKL